MEINIVDTVDRGLVTVWRQLSSMNQDPIEIANGPGGVERMIAAIIARAKVPNSISVLRIYSHGNSGIFVVTGGDGHHKEIEPDSLISSSNLAKLDSSLRRLTPFFKFGARVELMCCYVATDSIGKDSHIIKENSDGEQLIKGLAKIWHVKVLASGNTAKGLPISGLKFVGLVVQATPDGGLSCVPAPDIQKLK